MSGRIAVVVSLGLLCLLPLVLAAPFTCTFKGACTGSEVGLLRVSNVSDSYNNSHAQLWNYSGSAYDFELCCSTNASFTLNNSCGNSSTISVLNLNAETDAHVEVPTVNNYSYSACMGIQPNSLNCEYVNTTCSSGYSPVLSIASSEENGGYYNQTNAHVGNYSYYTLNVCCIANNSAPPAPTLLYPADGNNSVFERTINFNWSASADPDGDSVTYEFNLTSSSCLVTDSQSGITDTNYSTGVLDIDCVYNWTVRACDEYGLCGSWAATYNFTIASTLGITFTVNSTDFGYPALGATDDTTDGSPPPFTVENTGNIPANVTFKANAALFSAAALNTSNFQYKAREDEAGAYNETTSQTAWANVTASFTALFKNLDYSAATDSAFVDIRITVPGSEPGGAKSSVVVIEAAP